MRTLNHGEFEDSLCFGVQCLKETKGTHYTKGRLKALLFCHSVPHRVKGLQSVTPSTTG